MPNVITGHNDVLILLGATNGGWCVYAGTPDKTASEILEAAPAAGVADDEGLIEWFADQLALSAPALQMREIGSLELKIETGQALKDLEVVEKKALEVLELLGLNFQAYPPKPGPEAKPAEHGAPPVAGGDQIKHMVDRFLSWRLPETFNPDGGIVFNPIGNADTRYAYTREPSGTNLFDATQAEAMVRFMVEGLPSAPAVPPAANEIAIVGITYDAMKDEYVSASVLDLRTLMRAGGLWTDEMQAPAQDEGSAEEPEAAAVPPPPAKGDAGEDGDPVGVTNADDRENPF